MFQNLLFVAAGGAAGASLRWALAGWTQRLAGDPHFPAGTLAVNLLGCALIGALAAWFTTTPHGDAEEAVGRFALRASEPHHLLLFVGLLGGFTTFSSFALDTLALIETGERARALVYVLVSNCAGMTLAWTAYWGVERLLGVRASGGL